MRFKLRFKLHSLSCCFLGLLVLVNGHTQTSAPQVKFAGSLEAANAAPGRVVRAVFETTLPRGFHVNSNTPSDEFLKPTSLLLDTPAGVKIGRIDYPEPRPFKAEFSKEPLAVYEEHFVIGADLEIDQDLAPGDYPVKATLKYQVCSARMCYPPATRNAEIILALAAAPPAAASSAVSSKVTKSAGDSFQSRADEVVRSETAIESLRVPLAALSKSVANLRLPDERGRDVFASEVQVVDLGGAAAEAREQLLDLGFERGRWLPTNRSERVANSDISLWEEFLATVDFFHHFNFYNIRGGFEGENGYHTDAGFKGLAQLKSGPLFAIQGKLSLDWQGRTELVGDAEETVWRISRFRTKSFEFAEGAQPLFTDFGDIAFDPEDWRRAIKSPRDEMFTDIVLNIRSGAMDMEHFREMFREMQENPVGSDGGGIGPVQALVVDIDRDGFDDFYLIGTAAAMFFRNKGDGTFEEIGEKLGLAIEGIRWATFGDLDNDGDSDLFMTHFSREDATRYLVNEDGRFVDRTDTLELDLPNWVSSISMADYNNDGLLDVYLGRFLAGFEAIMVANEKAKERTGSYPDKFPLMDDAEARELFRRTREDGHPLAKRYAPQDWLLTNRGGGRFERATATGDEWGFHRAFASTWSDIDLDGDMDLYVVNEIGPNELMRNNGDGTFTNISNTFTGEIGFGMGGALGDYDNDGRPDIYTTNMYSKAGLRVSEQMQSSEIVTQSARGNTLMRNTPEGFIKVSSQDDSGIQVEAADFGFGGDFADLNNDGNLDLYVPAGSLSIPAEVATIGDS